MNKIQTPQRILIIRLDRIGDVLLSTPVIKALRDAYPDSYIAFIVQPHAKEIVDGNPYLNEVIVYKKKAGFIGNLSFISGLRRYEFDLAIILHPTARTHLLAFLAGIPQRVGYDKKLGFLLTKRIPHTKQFGLRHEVDYTLDLLSHIGISPKDRSLYMPVNSDSEDRISGMLSHRGVKGEDLLIAFNPGASCPSKRWDAARFAKVGDLLSGRYGAKIVIVCGSKDKEFGDRVAKEMKSASINLSGKTTIGDIASVLRRVKLLISNDSGPVHIACAVGTPVIAIFGRNDRGLSPARWGPTAKRASILHKDVGCPVCLAHNCRIAFKCLEAVTVEEVVDAACEMLGK